MRITLKALLEIAYDNRLQFHKKKTSDQENQELKCFASQSKKSQVPGPKISLSDSYKKKHTAGAAALWLVFLISVVTVPENKGKASRGPETKILK